MELGILSAFNNLRKDEHWIKKTILASLFAFYIPFVVGFIGGFCFGTDNVVSNIVVYVISFILGLFLLGFMYLSFNQKMNNENANYIEWNNKNILPTGFKVCIQIIVWALCCGLIAMGISLVIQLIFGLLTVFFHNISGIETAAHIHIPLLIVNLVVYILLFLYFMQLVYISITCYLKNLKFKDLLSFKKQFMILKDNQQLFWNLIGQIFLLSIISVLLVAVLAVTVVGIVLIPYLFPLIYFVTFELLVQFEKQIDVNKYLQKV